MQLPAPCRAGRFPAGEKGMPARFLLTSFAALMSSAAAFAQPAQIPGATQVIDKTTRTEDVKLKADEYERMTVPVRVSGSGPFRFLVDTGANRTAISQQLASRLNLAAGPSAALHSATGETNVSTAKISEIQLTRKAV